MPVVIASYALIIFYVDHGLLPSALTDIGIGYASPIYQQAGVIMGEVWTSIPFAVLMLGSGLDGLPQELVDAARRNFQVASSRELPWPGHSCSSQEFSCSTSHYRTSTRSYGCACVKK